MGAARPAAGAAHAFLDLRADPFDPALTGVRFPGVQHPANPLVARERRQILPAFQGVGVVRQRLSQVVWNAVHRARGDGVGVSGFHGGFLAAFGAAFRIFHGVEKSFP
jgi:hypothetical protein